MRSDSDNIDLLVSRRSYEVALKPHRREIVMARPPLPLIVKWRDLAQEGRFYTDIAKDSPDYTASQIRHYCLGNSGAKAPGPIQ